MKRVLVTRPRDQSAETGDKLRALGLEPVSAPLIAFAPIENLVLPQGPFQGVIVTSANAVTALGQAENAQGLRQLPVYAVGDKSAAAAREAGFADVQSAGGAAEDLLTLISARADKGDRLLYARGKRVSHNLGAALAPAGLSVQDLIVYDMPAARTLGAAQEALARGEIEMALFYSRRTAETFVHLCPWELAEKLKPSLRLLCLSNNVAQPLFQAGFARIGLADHPSEEAMLALALSEMRAHS